MQVRRYAKNNDLDLDAVLEALKVNFQGAWLKTSNITDQHIDYLNQFFDKASLPPSEELKQLPPAKESTAITETQADNIEGQSNNDSLKILNVEGLLDIDLVLQENEVQQRLDDHYTNLVNRISDHNQRIENTLLTSISARYEKVKNHKPVKVNQPKNRAAIDEMMQKIEALGIDIKS